jgi:preprotein translocase subunit SecG
MITAIVLIIDVISALFLIVFILLHSGKGGGLSDMFGGGAGLAGGTAVERRLDQVTVITAVLFAICSFYLALTLD